MSVWSSLQQPPHLLNVVAWFRQPTPACPLSHAHTFKKKKKSIASVNINDGLHTSVRMDRRGVEICRHLQGIYRVISSKCGGGRERLLSWSAHPCMFIKLLAHGNLLQPWVCLPFLSLVFLMLSPVSLLFHTQHSENGANLRCNRSMNKHTNRAATVFQVACDS